MLDTVFDQLHLNKLHIRPKIQEDIEFEPHLFFFQQNKINAYSSAGQLVNWSGRQMQKLFISIADFPLK